MDDKKIKTMVSYVVNFFNRNCPENLETMIHLIGHDDSYRKRVSELTEAIIDHHDELFVAYSNGEEIEEITPKYAQQCEDVRMKMRRLVAEYISECSISN